MKSAPPQTAEADFARLVVYLENVESTWCYALYDDVPTRDQLLERLRLRLAPMPVLERSLAGLGTDNALDVLRQIPLGHTAPVVCFTDLYNAIFQGVLAQSLDLQRELFAEMPHRLVFWLRAAEWKELYRQAPNFSSRTNGTFDFQLSAAPESHYEPPNLRPDPTAQAEQEKHRNGVEFLKRQLEFLDAQTPTDQREIARTLMEIGEAIKKLDGNHWAELEGLYSRAERHFASLNDQANQGDALFKAGKAAYYGGLSTGENQFKSALKLYRAVGDRLGEANTLQAIGDVLQLRKEVEISLKNYQNALELYRTVGDRLGEANTLKAIGDVSQFRKETEYALENYQNALDLYRAVSGKLGEANTLQAIGDVLQFCNKMEVALENYQNALELFRVIENRLGEANTLKAIGNVLQFRQETEVALENYQNALDLYRAVGDRLGEANTLKAIGDVLQFRDEIEAALENYQNALELFRAIKDRLGEANTLGGIARLQLHNNEVQGKETLEKALAASKSIGDQYSVAAHLGNFGITYFDLGKPEKAKPYLLEAAELFEEINLPDQAKQVRTLAES